MTDAQRLSNLLRVIAHPARLAILNLLREGEICVCQIEARLGYRQAYVSQHLMALREAGLVADRRQGWKVFYRPMRPGLFTLLDVAAEALDKSPVKAESGLNANANSPPARAARRRASARPRRDAVAAAQTRPG